VLPPELEAELARLGPNGPRHGGPYDRGAADFYYHRSPEPHFFIGGTGISKRVTSLTDEQRAAYFAGYDAAREIGDRKEWT